MARHPSKLPPAPSPASESWRIVCVEHPVPRVTPDADRELVLRILARLIARRIVAELREGQP